MENKLLLDNFYYSNIVNDVNFTNLVRLKGEFLEFLVLIKTRDKNSLQLLEFW